MKLTQEQQDYLNKWHGCLSKLDKAESARKFLNTCRKIKPESNNFNIHIYWTFDNYRFDLWPSTYKLWITDLEFKDKWTYIGLTDIKDILINKFSDML